MARLETRVCAAQSLKEQSSQNWKGRERERERERERDTGRARDNGE